MQKVTVQSVWQGFFREIIYGGHLQCLGAASIPYVSAFLLQIEIRMDCLITVYLLFYPLYLYNRFKELDTDETTNPERTKHFRKYQHRMPVLLVVVILAALLTVILRSNRITLLVSVLLLVFGLLYTVIFKRMTRHIPVFKNLYVAAFFAVLVVFPAIFYSHPLKIELVVKMAVLFSFVYLNAVVMQIILDMKDLESDRKEGLSTMPVIRGKAKTMAYVRTLSMLTAFGFPILFSGIMKLLPGIFWSLSLIFPFHMLILHLIQKDSRSGYHLTGAQFLVWVPFLWLGKTLLW